MSPSSYIPIYLLDATGKLLERLIMSRLSYHIESTGGLSPKQFGFRQGCFIIDTISTVVERKKLAGTGVVKNRDFNMLVIFDVKNVFNSAS